MGRHAQDAEWGNAEGVKVFTFELDSEFVNIARDLIELAGLSDIVTVVQGKSTDSIRGTEGRIRPRPGRCPLSRPLGGSVSARSPTVRGPIAAAQGSVILADNTDYPGAPEYLKYVKAGGRGGEGHVKYESVSHSTASKKGAPVSPLFFAYEVALTDFYVAVDCRSEPCCRRP